MRIMSFLLAGCLLGVLADLATAQSAYAQDEHSVIMGRYARRPPVYPNLYTNYYAYWKAVKQGLSPVLPPCVTRHQEGHGLYDAPCYVYPRPPLGCPGYAGVGGDEPGDFRAVIPPPIPPVMPPPINAESPGSTPTAPLPPAEKIPTPPSSPGSQS
jgi:hypothetical protein